MDAAAIAYVPAMRAAPFDYVCAASVVEAVDALGSDADTRVLAGGQSLVPVMALRLATPEVLVDVSRCQELLSYAVGGQVLTVGAAVTDRVLERDPHVRRAHPLLVSALALVAHPEIRARGTLCGSLAHADPAAELPAVLLATGGQVEVRGPSGTRTIEADDLCTGSFETSLAGGELVVAARLPLPAPRSGWAVEEVARRRGDFALVGVVCVLDVDEQDLCSRARVALFGVASTPVRAASAERALVGQRLRAAVLDEAAAACFDGVDVLGDEVHASAAYRRTAGRTLVRRALGVAAARTAGQVAA